MIFAIFGVRMAVAPVPEKRTFWSFLIMWWILWVTIYFQKKTHTHMNPEYTTGFLRTTRKHLRYEPIHFCRCLGYSKSSQLVHNLHPTHRSKLHQRGTVHLWHLASSQASKGWGRVENTETLIISVSKAYISLDLFTLLVVIKIWSYTIPFLKHDMFELSITWFLSE